MFMYVLPLHWIPELLSIPLNTGPSLSVNLFIPRINSRSEERGVHVHVVLYQVPVRSTGIDTGSYNTVVKTPLFGRDEIGNHREE